MVTLGRERIEVRAGALSAAPSGCIAEALQFRPQRADLAQEGGSVVALLRTQEPGGEGAAIGGLACIALLATVIPIVTLFASMGLIGAADTSLVSTLEPVLTITLSAIFLGERLGTAQLAGAVLVLSAVLILALSERKKPPRAGAQAA